MIETLLLISVAAGIFSMASPAVGTYTLTQDGPTIIRMNTRTGTMESCTVADNILTCQQITTNKVETK